MGKRVIVSLLFVASFILLITTSSFSQLPTPDMCNKCHAVDPVYQEWLASKHNLGHCFDCHIPCAKQASVLGPGEKKGFHILGYGYYDESSGQVVAVRLDAKEVCVRCHVSAHHNNNGSIKCYECHMPLDGLTTYRVHTGKPISFDGMNNNIKKYVTREHRVHTFQETYRPKHD